MTKSELIEILARRQAHLKADDVDLAVKSLLEMMGGALASGDRILFAGQRGVEILQKRFQLEPSPLIYVRTGIEPPRSWLFRKLLGKKGD